MIAEDPRTLRTRRQRSTRGEANFTEAQRRVVCMQYSTFPDVDFTMIDRGWRE
jgi:hypothetical protein